MLQNYFKERRTLLRLQEELFGPFLDSFSQALCDKGYSARWIRSYIRLASDFGRWCSVKNLVAQEVTIEHIAEYKSYRATHEGKPVYGTGIEIALQQLLMVVRPDCKSVLIELAPADSLLKEFLEYLSSERRLAPTTIRMYRLFVKRFLADYIGKEDLKFDSLNHADVIRFVQRQTELFVSNLQMMTSALRSFLRYLRYRGYVKIDLEHCVPRVAYRSHRGIPRGLSPEQIELVLSRCNRATIVGRRDYAILLLLARLGLRAGEVAALRLDDINWTEGTITVCGKTRCQSQLPLPHEVGEAIAQSLKDRKSGTPSRALFLRRRAPITQLKDGAAIGEIAIRALERAKVDAPKKGSHLFRHALATNMLKSGSTLTEIAELLRHQSPRSTAIYAKVDLDSLRTIALPWPGGVQ